MIPAQGVAAAIVDSLDEPALERLAERLAPRLERRLSSRPSDRWLPAREAAAHLGMSVHALHKLTAARAIPFEQDGPGCKLWLQRSELDRWRRGGAAGPPRNPSTPLPHRREAAS